MKIKFGVDLLYLIHLLQSYRRFVWDQHYYCKGDPQHNLDQEVFEYFAELPVPSGIQHNKACFRAIMSYPIDMLNQLDNLEEYALAEFEFGF